MNKYYKRVWLNLEGEGNAFLLAQEGELKIGDCSRIINLELDLPEEHWPDSIDGRIAQIDNVEYKIDTLYEEIKNYRKYLKQEIRKARRHKFTEEKDNV